MALLEDMVAPKRLGVFGGSFNPIHWGHLLAAEVAADALNLDTVLFVPAACSPFKLDDKQLSADERLRLCRLACKDNPRFAVSDLDIKRPSPSYAVDTLTELKQIYGVRTQFFFIAGTDILDRLEHWHRTSELAEAAQFVILERAGYAADQHKIAALRQDLGFQITLIPMPACDFSSSAIREDLARDKSVRYQLHPAVEAHIATHNLYKKG